MNETRKDMFNLLCSLRKLTLHVIQLDFYSEVVGFSLHELTPVQILRVATGTFKTIVTIQLKAKDMRTRTSKDDTQKPTIQ